MGGEGHGARDAGVEEGNVLAPNLKKRRVRIQSIVERGQRQKQKKVSTVRLTSIHLLQIEGNFTETSGGLTNLFYGCKN